MDAPGARDALPGSARCPICREFFRQPVSIHCGHHFCRPCIERCWERPTGGFACPRCRDTAPQRSLRPSPELERVLEIARRLSRGEGLGSGREEEEEEEEEGCQKHREPLEVFCKEDGALLCAICRESRAHRAHTVLPLAEAAREYQEQIQAELQTLEGDRDELLQLREAEMGRNWRCLERTAAERQQLQSQFQGLRRALEELSRRLLARLGRLERDLAAAQEESATRLTQEISRLECRARELEERRRQPARTFLQDIGSTLSRLGQDRPRPPPSPLPRLEQELRRFGEETEPLRGTLGRLREILEFELPEKMPVTLEPRSAHPRLLVAPDGGGVTWDGTGGGVSWDPPAGGTGAGVSWDPPAGGTGAGVSWDPPAGGTGAGTGPEAEAGPGTDPAVLGREAVTGGRRCWDVRVAPAGSWALGVARETPGNREGTPGRGGETPGNGGETPGRGEETLGNGEGTLGNGEGSPGNGADTLWSGAETTGRGTGTFGNGEETLETLGRGGETPGRGAETTRSGAGNLWSGVETTGRGVGTPGNGTGITRSGAETLGSGEETPGRWTGTPGNGTGTFGNGAGTLGNGEETPGRGEETPGRGEETPGSGAGSPGRGEETPGSGAGSPGSGEETPGSGPEWELWSLGQCQGQFWALSSRERVPLFPARAPRRVRVALDYERGRVAFFDADERSLLFAFPAAAFGGQRVRPWFLVWGEGSGISLCP